MMNYYGMEQSHSWGYGDPGYWGRWSLVATDGHVTAARVIWEGPGTGGRDRTPEEIERCNRLMTGDAVDRADVPKAVRKAPYAEDDRKSPARWVLLSEEQALALVPRWWIERMERWADQARDARMAPYAYRARRGQSRRRRSRGMVAPVVAALAALVVLAGRADADAPCRVSARDSAPDKAILVDARTDDALCDRADSYGLRGKRAGFTRTVIYCRQTSTSYRCTWRYAPTLPRARRPAE